jgi:hypothetical protein
MADPGGSADMLRGCRGQPLVVSAPQPPTRTGTPVL